MFLFFFLPRKERSFFISLSFSLSISRSKNKKKDKKKISPPISFFLHTISHSSLQIQQTHVPNMGVCFSIIKKCGSRSRNNSTNNENDSNNQKEDNPSFTKPTTVASASRNPQGQPAQQRQTAQKNLQQPVYKGNPKKPTGAVPCGKRTEFGYFKDFHKRYTIGKLLGHGQFGYTFVATSIDNGYRVAVKRIDKNKVFWELGFGVL